MSEVVYIITGMLVIGAVLASSAASEEPEGTDGFAWLAGVFLGVMVWPIMAGAMIYKLSERALSKTKEQPNDTE